MPTDFVVASADVVAIHKATVEHFGSIVVAIRPDQWHLPTPCADWNVHELVNHVTGEDLWTAPLLEGLTIAEVGDKFDGDVLGDDPVAAWTGACTEALVAAASPGATDVTTHLSFGDFPGSEYLWQLAADHLIHGWDLASAVGADTTLAPELVTAISAWFSPMEQAYRSAGVTGTRPPLADDADPQTTLLAMFGRSAPYGRSAT